MNLNINEFLLIIFYSFIQLSLSEDSSRELNPQTLSKDCSSFTDCFNCTINPSCRWNSSNDECVLYISNNSELSLPLFNLSSTNNLTLLNNYFNFIRKVCFLPTTSMINRNTDKNYNSKSIEYCGEHYIMTSQGELNNNFKIELKDNNGSYGLPNLLCEYIFFSGPDYFDIKININQEESNKFFLLYSNNSINFTKHINSTEVIEIRINPNKINTFLFYSFESFKSPPFTITYISNLWTKAFQATGYILLSLIIIIIGVIIYGIVYMRKHSLLFNKAKKEKKIKKKKNLNDKSKVEEINLMKKKSNETNITGPSLIKNFTPETPIGFLDKDNFSYEKCALDNMFINNKDDIYEAKCGHFYHKNCFNKLLEKASLCNKELKCVICHNNLM